MLLWIAFLGLIFVCLALDLGVFQRMRGADGELTLREATAWTLIWLTVGASFSGAVYYLFANNIDGFVLHRRDGSIVPHTDAGAAASIQYLTSYVLEWSLSVDNLFVISLLFKTFRVEPNYQHRVLFWGILGAVVSRGTMILVGFELVQKFSWLFYIFGVYLGYQGLKVLRESLSKGDDDDDGEAETERPEGWLEKNLRKVLPISPDYDRDRFTTRMNGVFQFTPALICLLVVEATDVVFALDSIPAVLAISTDKFIAFTSNIFAVLGLRSLYFVLAEMVERFSHLETSIAVILVFIGLKLFFHSYLHYLPEWVSLTFIGLCLTIGVVWSWRKGGQEILRKSQIAEELAQELAADQERTPPAA